MNYKPQCDSCKHFITTDKTHKSRKSNLFKSPIWFREDTGYCKLSYCVKEKKQIKI